MAIHVRVSLRGIHREIGAAVRKLRRARRHAERSEQGQLDSLARQLEELGRRTTMMCGRVYGVWPPPPAKTPAKPPAPRPPAKPKKGGRKRPRPKKGR